MKADDWDRVVGWCCAVIFVVYLVSLYYMEV